MNVSVVTDLIDVAQYDLSDTVGVIFKNVILFNLTYALCQLLPCHRHSPASERGDRNFLSKFIVELQIGVMLLGIFQGNFHDRVGQRMFWYNFATMQGLKFS